MSTRYGMVVWISMDARAQVKKFGVKRVDIEIYYAEKPSKVKVAKVGNI